MYRPCIDSHLHRFNDRPDRTGTRSWNNNTWPKVPPSHSLLNDLCFLLDLGGKTEWKSDEERQRQGARKPEIKNVPRWAPKHRRKVPHNRAQWAVVVVVVRCRTWARGEMAVVQGCVCGELNNYAWDAWILRWFLTDHPFAGG